MAMERQLGTVPEGAEEALGKEWVQRRVALDEKILDRIQTNPEFRAKLQEDAEKALAEAGLLDERRALREMARGEVTGHMGDTCGGGIDSYTYVQGGGGGSGGFMGEGGHGGDAEMCCEWSS